METKLVSIPIQGIQRNLPDYACLPGSCHEIINLRNRDGAWRSVGSKYTDAEMIIDDLADFAWIFRHPVLPDGYYIGEKAGSLHIVHENTTEAAFLNYRLKSSGEVAVSIDYIGSIIRVVTVYNDDYQYYLAKYDNITGTYIQLFDIARPRIMFVNTGHENNPMVAEVASTVAGAAGMYAKKMNELSAAGYIEGHVLFMLAYRMSDGSFVKHSQPYYHYIAEPYLISTLEVEPSGDNFQYSNIHVGKPKVKLKYYDSEIVNLTGYTGLIQSLCVFMTKPRSNFVPGTYNEAETLVLQNPSVQSLPEESNYYLVHEIALEDILDFNVVGDGSSISGFLEIDVKGIENIATKELLPVDNYSNHQIFGKRSFLFNERLHMGDITTILGDSLNQFWWHTDDVPAEDSPVLTSDAQNINALSLVVTLRTEDGDREVRVLPSTIAIYTSGAYYYLDPILSYPDDRAYKIELFYGQNKISSWNLKAHSGLNLAYNAIYNLATNTFYRRVFAVSNAGTSQAASGLSDVIYDSNRVQVSAQNSIFSFPAANSYRIGLKSNVVLGFGTIGEPISEGQYGQFPLYVFHNDGISTLEQGTGEVLYQSVQPIAKDVCNNPASIISIGGAVLFSTKTGLKVISGRQVTDISDPVEGTIPLYLHIDSYVDVLSNSYLSELYENLSGVNFRVFLEDAIIAYDYENREILVSNPTVQSGNWTEQYSYVFNLDSKTWHKISDNFTQFLNNYPGYLGVIGTSLYDISREDETVYAHSLIQTRPITFENKFSKIIRGRLCGYFHAADLTFVTLFIFGSQDGRNYSLLGGTQASDREFMDIKLARSHVSCRYFIFMVCGQLSGSDISHLEIEYMPTFDSKLR